MSKIFWLDSAVDDLVRLRSFLEEVNPNAANKVAILIKDAADKLQNFPLIGKPVEELEEFYDFFVEFGAGGYQLRYRFFNQKIYIVHIKHTKELSFKIHN